MALCRHAVLRDGDAQDVLQPIMSRGSGVLMPVSPATQEAGTLAEPTLAPASPQPAQRVEPSALMPELECAVPAPRACSAPAAHPTVKAEARRVPTGFGACTAGWEPEAACADVPEPETPPSALEAVPSARAAALQPQPADGHAGRRQLLGPKRRSLPRLPVVLEEELAELPRRRSTLAGTPAEIAALQAVPAMHRRYTDVSIAAALQDTALVRYVPCPPFFSGSKSVDGAAAEPAADPKGGQPAGSSGREAAGRLRLKRPAASAPLPPGPSGGADGANKGAGRSVGRVCLPPEARLRGAFERALLGSTDVTGLLARGDDNLDRAIMSAHGAPCLAVWYLAQQHKQGQGLLPCCTRCSSDANQKHSHGMRAPDMHV